MKKKFVYNTVDVTLPDENIDIPHKYRSIMTLKFICFSFHLCIQPKNKRIMLTDVGKKSTRQREVTQT